MFAAPLPPGPPLTSTALSAPPPSNHFHDSLIRSNPDYLHQDLNNRLLAHNRDVAAAAASATVPPYLPRETTHHHNHLHNHQHMHQHTYGGALGPPPISNLVPTPSPHLGTELNPFSSLSFQYDKIPKAYESGLYRPSLLQGYAGFSLLPQAPTATPGHISSSLHGAFQPKARPATGSFFKESAAMNPGQVMLPLRDREKPAPSTASLPPKKGKWCAVHVRIAWEIYHHQQKLDSKGGDPKHPADPLRLIGPRPPDLASHTLPTSLFSGVGRSLMDGIPHPSSGFLGHGPLGMSSFPRPSPHPLGTSLTSFGGLGSLFGNAPGREISAVPGLTSPQEWSRLQRTPSSFPTWPKPDYEREKELEREREREQERREQERERERELERKKEEERERERRLAESRSLGMLELERSSRDKYRDGVRPPSRSRSRSPIRNGRLEPPKPDPMLEKAGLMKLKEERRPEDELLERDKMFRSLGTVPGMPPDYLGLPGPLAPSSAASLVGLNMMDRSRMLAPPPVTHYLPGAIERAPTHPSLWSPFDKVGVSSAAAAAAAWDLERERMARLGSMAYDERLLRDQQEREDIRRYYERLPQLERERAIMEQAKMTGMRPEHFFNRTLSPALNHVSSKSNSPAGLPGGPPPLISSAIAGHPPGFHTSLPPHSLAHAHSLAHHAHSARSHDNSPTSSKTKGYSPADSTTDGKDKRDSNSTDPEAHSR